LAASYLVKLDKQFFSGAVEIFFGQRWLSQPPPRKIVRTLLRKFAAVPFKYCDKNFEDNFSNQEFGLLMLHGSMKNMERSVNNGLVALAISDLFLCLVYFIASLYWNKLSYDSLPELYYRTYQESFINFFLLAR